MSDQLSFSLVIPTHNRADSLRRTIESALAIEYPPHLLEILVVDNASTDATKAVTEEYLKLGTGPEVRYVPEPQLGLHHARHAGGRAAKGDIVLFTDDDATFAPEWVQAYANAFTAHPELAAAGGPVEPIWEQEPPEWLWIFMGDYRDGFMVLSIWEPYQELQLEKGGFFFYGVNMVVRRAVLFRAGGFNPEAFGKAWLGDGETGLNRKLKELGEYVAYVPEARVYHHIPPGRMTVDYFCRRMSNEGACEIYAEYHKGMPSTKQLCRRAASILKHNWRVWRAARLLRGRPEKASLGVQMEAARTRSQFAYVFRLIFSKRLRALVLKEDWLNHPKV